MVFIVYVVHGLSDSGFIVYSACDTCFLRHVHVLQGMIYLFTVHVWCGVSLTLCVPSACIAGFL